MTTPDLANATWRKSSRSANGGNCVEVALSLPGLIAVRDSKNPAGAALVLTPVHWQAFLTNAASGAFSL